MANFALAAAARDALGKLMLHHDIDKSDRLVSTLKGIG